MLPGSAAALRADSQLAVALQRRCGTAAAVTAARVLSGVGEHALGWFALSGAGAVLDPGRRALWIRAGAASFVAHGTAVAVKRVIRRPRPLLDGLLVHSRTLSTLSFPSSHAASTSAAAVALMPVLGPALLPVAVAMGGARVLLGVHYPSDVVAGTALGALCGTVATRWGVTP